MTITTASIRDISSKGIPAPSIQVPQYGYEDWYRNPSWLTLPTVSPTESKVVGLYKVDPTNNYIAVICQTIGSVQYTVDWGDGVVDTVNHNATINHTYDFSNSLLSGTDAPVTLDANNNTINRNNHGYSNGMVVSLYNIVTTTGIDTGAQYFVINATTNSFQISTTKNGSAVTFTNNGSATLLNYKQAIVTITGTTQQLSSVNFSVRNTTAQGGSSSSGWLDIIFSGTNLTSISSSLTNLYLEQAQLISNNACGSFSGLFNGATRLQSIPKWTFGSSVTVNATNMFANCQLLRKLPEYENFNTDRILNANNMFNNCRGLITVPSYVWTTCTNFTATFSSCTALQTVGNFTGTQNINTTSGMFQNCYSLKVAPFFDTQNVNNFGSMFLNCYALETVPLYDMTKNTALASTFAQCYVLKEIPLFNTSNVTNMSSAFSQCRNLTEVPLLNTSNVTVMSGTFNNCHALKTIPQFNTNKVTTTSGMFDTCYSLVEIPLLNTSNVTDMSGTFVGCASLQEIPEIDTSNVANMANLFNNIFSGASTLKRIPLLDTSKVTNMTAMFRNLQSLVYVPDLNTSNVTNFSSMFLNCFSLEKVPQFDTSKATTVGGMFDVCTSLTSIPALDFSNATTIGSFASCNNCSEMSFTGSKVSLNITNAKLYKDQLEIVFENLQPNATSQTITITGTPGSYIGATGSNTGISRGSCTTTVNQTSITNTGIQAAGVTAGMYASGTGVTTALSVTANSTTDRFSSATLTFTNACIGSRVSFTTTANGVTQFVIYYVVGVESGQIKVSTTPNGAPVDLTGNGTMTMNIENSVVSVSTNSVEMAFPSSATGSQTLVFRPLNTNIARLKNWTVTG